MLPCLLLRSLMFPFRCRQCHAGLPNRRSLLHPPNQTSPLLPSPLCHEVYRRESTLSLNREMPLSPQKGEHSDGATSMASTEHFAETSSTPTTPSVLDSGKSRLTSPDVLASLSDGPVLQSVSIAPVSAPLDVAAAISASQTIWFGPLSKRFSHSSMSLSAAAEASDHALLPEPSHGSVAITQDSPSDLEPALQVLYCFFSLGRVLLIALYQFQFRVHLMTGYLRLFLIAYDSPTISCSSVASGTLCTKHSTMRSSKACHLNLHICPLEEPSGTFPSGLQKLRLILNLCVTLRPAISLLNQSHQVNQAHLALVKTVIHEPTHP